MASKKKEETDLTELLKDVAKNWYIMLPCLVVAGIVGVFVSLWIRPVYQVDALLQIESKNSKNSMGMMGGLGALFSNASPAETEIELIRSRQVMGAAVEKMRLQYEAEPLNFLDRLLHREGRLDLAQIEVPWDSVPKTDKIKEWEVEIKDSTGRFDLYDHLDKVVLSGEPGHTYKFPYAGDSAAFGIISCDVRPGQRFVVRKRKRLDAISSFRSAFDVKEKGKKTGILEFTYQDIYPDRGMAVLNEVASSYLRQNVEERNAEAQKTLEFLESNCLM